MLKNIVKIQYNSDFTLNCKLPNGYSGEDFIIRLYTTDKASYFEASYLNGEYSNCLTDDDNKNVVVYVNNHGLQPGCLHVGLQIDYDNTHFQDNVENIITAEETNVYLVKQNANATSAMYVGSALPDLTGSSDFITQSDLEFELLNYYTKEDIDNASYISSADLNDYVTEEELNDMGFLSQSQLDAMGYTTKDYVDIKTNQKQDRLISAVNIKTVNGNSLLGNGNLSISGISQDDLDNAIAPLVSQEALTETLSYYVSHAELNSASYATQSFVDDAIADAMTEIVVPTYTSDLTNDSGFITASDLNGYATETYVSDYVAQHTPTPDLSAYVTKTELSNAGYVSQSQLSQAGYATETYVSNYVSQHAPTPDLSAYVTKTELSNAGYVTTNDVPAIDENITPKANNTYYLGSSTNLYNKTYTNEVGQVGAKIVFEVNRYISFGGQSGTIFNCDTSDKVIAPNSNNSVSLGRNNATFKLAYINKIWINGETAGASKEISDVFATKSYVSDYVAQHAPTPDLSAYVTKTELSNASYVTQNILSNAGYITSIPAEYVTESELSAKSYATTSQLTNKQDTLVSGTNIKTVNNESLLGSGNITITGGSSISEVTQAEYDAMEQAGTLDPNTIYVITDAAPTDLSYYAELTYVDTYYVSKSQLNSAGYVTGTDLSNMSYATTSQLSDKQDTLVSGTNIKTINNNSLLGSGNINIQSGSTVTAVTQAQYDAMEQAGTLDSTVLYVITDAIGADLSDYVETSYLETYYADKTYVSDYVAQHAPTPDLSAYVTKTELSNAGYLTYIPNTYATYAAISNMGYLTSANFIYDSSTYTLTISI